MTAHPPLDSRRNERYDSSRSIARGISWAVMMRWAIRFIGLFSTIILARLLSPEDFGIVAMGMLVVHFLFELSEFGTSMHLIRAREIDRAQCDTAWTITLLQGVGTGVILAVLAVPASLYFKEPRVVEVMYVLAFATVLGGLENIGPVLMRRDLKFALDFRFNVYKKLLVFLMTVGSALVFRNYWALVIGHLTGTAAGVALSYAMHSYRPRWSLACAGEYLRFGAAIIPLRMANTLRGMIGSFLVAGLGNAAIMGSYRIATDLSSMFTSEIVTPMGRGLLPNYARLADKPEELSVMYRKILGMVALLCIPVGIGVATVANDLILVLLGPQWGTAAELMPYLAVAATIYAITQTMVNQILVATGRERSAAVLAWIRLAVALPILWTGMQWGGVMGLAKAGIVVGLVNFPIIYNETRRAVKLPVLSLVELLWRPIAAAVTMHVVVKYFHAESFEWATLRLLVDVALGATIFIGTVSVLWVLSGRPRGAETIVFGLIAGVLRRIFRRGTPQ